MASSGEQSSRGATASGVARWLRPSFRVVLFVVILPQIAVAVAVTGYMAYRSARRSIEEVAAVLRAETTARIQDNLTEFFELAPTITRLNQESAAVGRLDLADLEEVALTFWKQLEVFRSLSWVTFGRADGGYLSLQRLTGDVMEIERSIDGTVYTHVLMPDGSNGELLRVRPDYDPRVRPWYRSAVDAGGLVWTGPYQWIGLDVLCVDAVAPVTDAGGAVLGVLDAGFSLSGLGDFLAELAVSQSGRTFIVERSGMLVATSSGGVLSLAEAEGPQRVAARESGDALVRDAFVALQQRHGDLTRVAGAVDFEFDHRGSRVFVQAAPVNPAIGLDWLIVVALPDDALMAHIEGNVRNTLLASIGALVIALVVSLLVTRWIARPLMDLAQRARRIQHGDLDVAFVPRSNDEIGVLTQTMSDMVAGLKERERIRGAFGRYMQEEVARELLDDPEALKPGGKLQTVTVLMTDLRGFSVFTARLGPAGMVQLLNKYLGCMTDVIKRYQGLINDFIGDAIMVVFGAPDVRPDDADRAFRCALAMQVAMEELNREIRQEFHLELGMGVGIDTGEVVVGNIGGDLRVKYGVLGDPVNMAARIESLTIGGQILVSRPALEAAGDPFEVGRPMAVKVKGRDEALTVYELLGAREDPSLRVRSADDASMQAVALDADLWVLSDKALAEHPSRVTVTRLGERTVELIAVGSDVEPMQNVKLRLREPRGETTGWYAKVRSVAAADPASTIQAGARRILLALTHEAEHAIDERLRQPVEHALSGEFPAVSADASANPSGDFLARLARGPIERPRDKEMTARMLAEIAAADGVLQPAEVELVGRFADSRLDAIEALMARQPLTPEELAAASPGAPRETMLLLAWATALCDAKVSDAELARMEALAAGLGVDSGRAAQLRASAAEYLAGFGRRER